LALTAARWHNTETDAAAGQTGARAEVIWHDVECGAYAADLALWSQLAAEAAGPLLELGAGTGRVAMHLADEGLDVAALDNSPALLAELRRRARERGLRVETIDADARGLDLERRFAAIVAPMQLVHLLGGAEGRLRMLAGARAHLRAGGVLAAALLADVVVVPPAGPPPLPDVRERDGWVYSSLPLEVIAVAGAFEVRRLRQVVAPSGELSEVVSSVRLDALDADGLEAEAALLGLRPRERLEIPPTGDHVGSVVCVLESR
jgi:SAM-dependent methyltransferase